VNRARLDVLRAGTQSAWTLRDKGLVFAFGGRFRRTLGRYAGGTLRDVPLAKTLFPDGGALTKAKSATKTRLSLPEKAFCGARAFLMPAARTCDASAHPPPCLLFGAAPSRRLTFPSVAGGGRAFCTHARRAVERRRYKASIIYLLFL